MSESSVLSERLLLAAFGLVVEVRGPAEMLAQVDRSLPPDYRPGFGSPERCWSLEHRDHGIWSVMACAGSAGEPAELIGERLDLGDATGMLLSDLELWVAEHARERIFVHAGCVAIGSRALVLPGLTKAGKSRLTAALLRAGAQYLSDEFAVIDKTGQVHPYARALSLRAENGAGAQPTSAAELGATTCVEPVQIALVARLRYDSALSEGLAVESLSSSFGVTALLANTVPARTRPAAALATLTLATRSAAAIQGRRGDAHAAAERLLHMLAQQPVG